MVYDEIQYRADRDGDKHVEDRVLLDEHRDAQISSPSGNATHCKCRVQSGSESKQASVSAAQPMTCILGSTFVLVSAV